MNFPPIFQDGSDDDTIWRGGKGYESGDRLKRKAMEAEANKLGHGVSGSTSPPGYDSSSASRSALEAAGFPVVDSPTKGNPGHVTIILPYDITREIADKFNDLFGRNRRR